MNSKNQKTILLVEDEALIAMMGMKTIKSFGYEVIHTITGEKAVELALSNNELNLILMDIDLGIGIDGPEAARQILEKRNIPIVFQTSHMEEEYVDRVKKITRYGYVIKNSGNFVLKSSIEMAFELFEAHQKTKEKEKLYQLTLDSIPNTSILIFDHEQRYQIVGGDEIRKSGFDKSIVLGKTLREAYPPVVHEMFEPLFEKALHGEETSFEMKYEDLTYHQQVIPVYDLNGNVSYGMNIAQNITDHRMAEEEIRIKNEELSAANEEMNAAMEEMEASNQELIYSNQELQKAENEIQENRNLLRTLIDGLPFWQSCVDLEGNYLIANKYYAETFKIPLEKIEGHNLKEFFPPILYEKHIKQFNECVNSGKIIVYDDEHDFEENKTTYLHCFYTPLYDYNKKVYGVIATAFDATKTKELEKELIKTKEKAEENEAKFRKSIEYSPIPIAVAKKNGELILLNKQFTETYGYSINEMPSIQKWFELVYPDIEYRNFVLEDWGNAVAYAIKNNIPTTQKEYTVTCKNGEVKIVEVSAYFENELAIGLFQDITVRKQIEEALIRSDERFKMVAENFPDGIIALYDSELRYIYAEGLGLAEIGLSKEMLLGKKPQDLFPADFCEILERKIQDAFKGKKETFEIKLGNDFFSETVLPLRNNNNEIIVVMGVITNITDKKKAEEEIRLQLSEKTILLKEVHHRIKNNIYSIEAFLSMQMNFIKNPEAVSILQDSIGRVSSMRILYDKLLISDKYKDTSIKNYMESLIDAVINLFPNNLNVSINKQIDDFILSSKDIFAIGIIINELLTNIIKYSFKDRESGIINITLMNIQNQATLTIQDNGNSFPEGFNIGESKGFGLMIVRMLSEQLGGTFVIESHNGTRSTLKFNI